MENKNGTQTETIYGTIQTENSNGSAARREAHRANLPGVGSDGFAGVQMAQRIHGKSARNLSEGKITRKEASDGNERIAELERLVGQLTMENALLKKGSSFLEVAQRRNGQ